MLRHVTSCLLLAAFHSFRYDFGIHLRTCAASLFDAVPVMAEGAVMSAGPTGKTSYRVKADSIEACNCQHGCNCQFMGFPNDGKCEFIIGFRVTDGRVGDVSLNGLRAAIAAKYPKAIHDGDGH